MSELVGPGSKYSDEDRRRAVLEYAICGVASKVARNMNIPETTLSGWRKTDWWDGMLAEVRSEKEAKILADNERVMDLAQREIEDRLENGDVQLVRTKDGVKTHRVPVKAKDAAVIKGIAEDKRRVQLNLPTSITNNSNTRERLQELADFFGELGRQQIEKRANSIPGECEEIE